jgi:hypothetical protein
MFNNVGIVDRFLRLVASSVLLYLGLMIYPGSAVGIALDVVGAVALFSGVFGSCALYGLLGINTRKPNQDSLS